MALQQTTGFWPVAAALCGNALVTIIKFVAATASGSSAMFSEAIHSLADTLNQALLLVGLRRSLKKPDDIFEYGYGNERFFWALISACGILFVGAGITAYGGLERLGQPHEVEFSLLIFIVLAVSFLIEFYTFWVADRNLKTAHPDETWLERVRAADPATLAVYLEDGIAVIGIGVATCSILLSYYTGNVLWDVLGTFVISALLAVTAVVLIAKNRAYLIGRAMPEEMEQEILEFLNADPAIEKVSDFKSTGVGFGVYRIKCEIDFNGSALFDEAYQQEQLRAQFDEVNNDYEAFKRFCVDYADRIPRLMGNMIDDIEARLRKRFPAVRHIDIEIN